MTIETIIQDILSAGPAFARWHPELAALAAKWRGKTDGLPLWDGAHTITDPTVLALLADAGDFLAGPAGRFRAEAWGIWHIATFGEPSRDMLGLS